jgi:SAM-dependent methyltransferase
MDKNTVEILNDTIDVEEIMQKIQDNIRRRHVADASCSGPDDLQSSLLQDGFHSGFDESLKHDLCLLSSMENINNNNYFISSHHPYLGKFLIKGRQLIHSEVRRYVDPIISQQNKFNLMDIRILTQIIQKSEKLENRISFQEEELKSTITDIDNRFRLVFTQVDSDLKSRISLAHVLEGRIAQRLKKSVNLDQEKKSFPNYLLFEDQFRGFPEDIKTRQLEFLSYFEKSVRVLDIGCGRGEFLGILRDHKIGGIGVDLDPDMIEYCRSNHLDVELSDAITYLERQDDESLDGIFIDQVVEHLEPAYLVRLLALCYQKLKSGFYIVIETVNPLSFVSFVNFYIDMTHTKPVHPETLKFLIGSVGFKEIETKVTTPVAAEYRLKKVPDISGTDQTLKEFNVIYNENIEKLNNILYGDQDYSVIARKC